MTVASIGFGIVFGRETGTPGTYASIGELIDVTPPGKTRETVDATHHGSADKYREFISALRAQKDATAVIAFEPGGDSWDDLDADYEDDAPHKYKITFPDGTESVIFTAFVTDLTPATPLENKMILTATFKPTGKPTWS